MNSSIIFSLLILLVTQSIIAFVPHWTRQTENFGVSIPEDFYYREDFRMMRRNYSLILLIINLLLTSILAVTSFYVDENKFFILFSLAIGFFLFLSFILYLPYHFQMKSIKKKEAWNMDKEEVIVVDPLFSQEKLTYSNYWFLIPFAIISFTFLFSYLNYEVMPNQLPIHRSITGQVSYVEKSVISVYLLPITQIGLLILFIFINYIIRRAKQVIHVQNPKGSKVQNILFRRRWSCFILFMSSLITALLSFVQLSFIFPSLQAYHLPVTSLIVFLIMAASLYLSITTGQGGSRIKVKGEKQLERIERDEDDYWKLGQFYFNKEDPSIFVEKRFGIGWTNNWAHPISWLLLLALVLLPLSFLFFI